MTRLRAIINDLPYLFICVTLGAACAVMDAIDDLVHLITHMED